MVNALDRAWIPRGVARAPLTRFGLWIALWLGVLALGGYAMYLCLAEGLFHTNMDNRYVFGLWIFLDLTVIALGAGAFFTGFLLYVLRKKELKAVINSAVVIGLVCYSGAMVILAVDVGQPLRAWFTYWHPNAHSMLAEVTFCITCYLLVLCIEYIPLLLKNRRLRDIGGYLVFEHELHKLMVVFALIGTSALLLPPGLSRRPLRRPARPPLRLPRGLRHLAQHILPLHPLRHGRRAFFHRSHHLAG